MLYNILGLGAPVGSVLCSDAATVKRAHRVRKAVGGGMRQAGIIAAGCKLVWFLRPTLETEAYSVPSALYAITEMSKRIHIDNQHAREFAEIVAKYDFVDINLKLVHTNIVRFKLKSHSQPEFIKNLATDRIIPIKCLEVSGGFIRLGCLKYM